MALSDFEPVIGSSFDSIAAQRSGWAGFNARMQENNIARLNQAEQTQNDWLRQLSALQEASKRSDIALAQTADESRRAERARQQDLALQEKFRAQDIGLTKDRIAAENKRTEKMGEIANTNLALKNKQAEQAIETAGQSAANSYLIAKNNADAASHAFDKIQADIDDIEGQRKDELAKPEKTRDLQKMNDYVAKIKALTTQLRQAENVKNRAENQFQSLANHIQNRGFVLDLDNNQVVHPPTGKKWTFQATLRDAQNTLSRPGPADDGGDASADDSGDWSSAYGQTSGTGTSAPVAPSPLTASTGSPRVRRYNPSTDSFE